MPNDKDNQAAPAAPAEAGPKQVRLLNKGDGSMVVAAKGRTYEIPQGESKLAREVWDLLVKEAPAIKRWLEPYKKLDQAGDVEWERPALLEVLKD